LKEPVRVEGTMKERMKKNIKIEKGGVLGNMAERINEYVTPLI